MARRELVVLLFLIHAVALATANKFTVGDEHGWNPNVNYTIWEEKHRPFYVGDWIVFYYQSGQADVVQVDEVGYNKCDASNAISNYSKGRSYAFQLNQTKHYYFICSYGYCYGGMKLAIKAQALPPPSPPPKGNKSDAFSVVGSRFVGSIAGFFGLVIFFWLF
ncbi:early nodulin-like protein 17 [Carex rostrata]